MIAVKQKHKTSIFLTGKLAFLALSFLLTQKTINCDGDKEPSEKKGVHQDLASGSGSSRFLQSIDFQMSRDCPFPFLIYIVKK